jgi:hypothetical protein
MSSASARGGRPVSAAGPSHAARPLPPARSPRGLVLVAEATRDLPLAEATVETPLETTTVRRLAARVVAVPVLRAGLGMLDALLELVPQAQVGYFGLERDEVTAVARRYYEKVPQDLGGASVFLLDPMLATGGSATMAIEGLAELGARRVRLLSIVSAPEDSPTSRRRSPTSRSTPRRSTASSTRGSSLLHAIYASVASRVAYGSTATSSR